MDIKLYILLKIVHSNENCTFYRKLYISLKIVHLINIWPKIEHFTKIRVLNQKLDI